MAITTITNAMVSVNAIQGTLIADNAITAVHIATNAVSGTLIADNAVTATHIAQNTITVTQLADDAVEADKIADGVITTNHLNKAMISSQTEVTPVAGDFVLIGDTSDSNNLKKVLVSGITSLATISGISSSADATAITIGSDESVDFAKGIVVEGSGTTAGLYLNGTNSDSITQGNFVRYGTNFVTQSDSANDDLITYAFNGSTFVNALNVKSNGNVGVGSTNPQSPLHIQESVSTAYDGATQLNETLIVDNKNGTDDSGVNNYANLTFRIADGATSYGHLNYIRDGNNTGKFTLSQRTSASTWEENYTFARTGELTNAGGQPALFLQDTTAGGGAGNGGQVIFKGHHASANDGFREFAKILGLKYNGTGGDTHGELRFYVNKGTASAAEAGRFNHDGMLLLCGANSSHQSPSFTDGILFTSKDDNEPHIENKVNHTNSFGLYKFQNSNGTVGSISMFSSAVSYNTTSDYRLKENVNYTWDATNKLKQLKPCEFEFKADSDNVVHQGFLAHEVDSIVPTSVFGEKDGEEMQQLDHSKLVPLLVKTIQELEARIKILEG